MNKSLNANTIASEYLSQADECGVARMLCKDRESAECVAMSLDVASRGRANVYRIEPVEEYMVHWVKISVVPAVKSGWSGELGGSV